jgi:hypothetical protein
MERAYARQMPTQPSEASPRGLFGQLGHYQIERMRWGQQRQQMHAPQLGRVQSAPTPARELVRAQFINKGVGYIRCQQFQQAMCASGRKNGSHAWTLPESCPLTSPLVLAKTASHKEVTKTFGTPSVKQIVGFLTLHFLRNSGVSIIVFIVQWYPRFS